MLSKYLKTSFKAIMFRRRGDDTNKRTLHSNHTYSFGLVHVFKMGIHFVCLLFIHCDSQSRFL